MIAGMESIVSGTGLFGGIAWDMEGHQHRGTFGEQWPALLYWLEHFGLALYRTGRKMCRDKARMYLPQLRTP